MSGFGRVGTYILFKRRDIFRAKVKNAHDLPSVRVDASSLAYMCDGAQSYIQHSGAHLFTKPPPQPGCCMQKPRVTLPLVAVKSKTSCIRN